MYAVWCLIHIQPCLEQLTLYYRCPPPPLNITVGPALHWNPWEAILMHLRNGKAGRRRLRSALETTDESDLPSTITMLMHWKIWLLTFIWKETEKWSSLCLLSVINMFVSLRFANEEARHMYRLGVIYNADRPELFDLNILRNPHVIHWCWPLPWRLFADKKKKFLWLIIILLATVITHSKALPSNALYRFQ